MAQYGHRYGRRKRRLQRRGNGRRVLPVLFCLMLCTAGILTAKKILPTAPLDLVAIRDQGDTGVFVSHETETIPGVETADETTSASLSAETGNDPVETLVSVKSETTSVETTAPVPTPLGLKQRIPTDYDYDAPVPESDAVTMSYFDDAVLVGDSRMQGLILYCGLSQIPSYTYKGLTVDSVFTRAVIPWTEDADLPEDERIPAELWSEGKVPVMSALSQTDYNKVYIMLGINETGWPEPAYFPQAYEKIIDTIRADHPDCLIYMLSIFPVTKAVSDYHDYVTNEKIALYNDYLMTLAAEKEVFFVDLAPAVVNDDGVLPEDAGVDGIHLGKVYCQKVLDYLLTHTVPLLTEEEARAVQEE